MARAPFDELTDIDLEQLAETQAHEEKSDAEIIKAWEKQLEAAEAEALLDAAEGEQ